MRNLFFFFYFLLPTIGIYAQQVQLKGTVQDTEGLTLPAAYVHFPQLNQTAVTNESGNFTLTIPKGKWQVNISYLGYKDFKKNIQFQSDTSLVFVLESSQTVLKDVVVTGDRFRQSEILTTTRMSTVTLSSAEINAIPVLGGEADVIKVIQLLPGAARGVEGSTDLFIRGGGADQNLVLFDGAPVYNTGHLFGFLSVFHPDAVESAESINGAFPAQYGGRLSSILDIRSQSVLADETSVKGNVGLIASRLMIEQPIVKQKLSVWVSGRRTYIDQVIKLTGEELPYFFYDVNAKLIYQPSERDKFELGYYIGDDLLDFAGDSDRNIQSNFTIGNQSFTFKWLRKLSSGWDSELTLFRTKFRYTIKNTFEDSELFIASQIEDQGGKWQLSKSFHTNWRLTSGVEVLQHQVDPNVINTSGEISELLESSATPKQNVTEASVFTQLDYDAGKRWAFSAGFRFSTALVRDANYYNPEPRFFVRYLLDENTTVKASYSRMFQYLHRVSSAAVALPTDIWYPVTNGVLPQSSHQIALSYQKRLPKHDLFLSVEAYYKSLNQLIGYREGASVAFNTEFEEQLVQGIGRAYGLELLLKKEAGKLTGWIAYTLSRAERQFDEVNNGDWFLARYDRRHNLSVVGNYAFNDRWSFSAVFEFLSGARFTPIIGQYVSPVPTGLGVNLIPVYAPLNSVKLADTHRLDLGIKLRNKAHRKIKGEWFFGIYNIYNRASPIGISIEVDENGGLRYEQPGLFGTIPSISYSFEF